VPQNIDQVTSAKSVPEGGESPKVDKLPSLQAEKTMPESMKPLSPKDARGPVNVDDAPTSSTPFTSSHDATLDSPRPKSIDRSEMSLWSPRFHGLGAPNGSQLGEGSSVPLLGEQLRPHSRVAESL
jgi:hypothetical protein